MSGQFRENGPNNVNDSKRTSRKRGRKSLASTNTRDKKKSRKNYVIVKKKRRNVKIRKKKALQMENPEEELKDGKKEVRVRLINLKKENLNGLLGTKTTYDSDSKRYKIVLDNKKMTSGWKGHCKVKRENFEIIEESDLPIAEPLIPFGTVNPGQTIVRNSTGSPLPIAEPLIPFGTTNPGQTVVRNSTGPIAHKVHSDTTRSHQLIESAVSEFTNNDWDLGWFRDQLEVKGIDLDIETINKIFVKNLKRDTETNDILNNSNLDNDEKFNEILKKIEYHWDMNTFAEEIKKAQGETQSVPINFTGETKLPTTTSPTTTPSSEPPSEPSSSDEDNSGKEDNDGMDEEPPSEPPSSDEENSGEEDNDGMDEEFALKLKNVMDGMNEKWTERARKDNTRKLPTQVVYHPKHPHHTVRVNKEFTDKIRRGVVIKALAMYGTVEDTIKYLKSVSDTWANMQVNWSGSLDWKDLVDQDTNRFTNSHFSTANGGRIFGLDNKRLNDNNTPGERQWTRSIYVQSSKTPIRFLLEGRHWTCNMNFCKQKWKCVTCDHESPIESFGYWSSDDPNQRIIPPIIFKPIGNSGNSVNPYPTTNHIGNPSQPRLKRICFSCICPSLNPNAWVDKQDIYDQGGKDGYGIGDRRRNIHPRTPNITTLGYLKNAFPIPLNSDLTIRLQPFPAQMRRGQLYTGYYYTRWGGGPNWTPTEIEHKYMASDHKYKTNTIQLNRCIGRINNGFSGDYNEDSFYNQLFYWGQGSGNGGYGNIDLIDGIKVKKIPHAQSLTTDEIKRNEILETRNFHMVKEEPLNENDIWWCDMCGRNGKCGISRWKDDATNTTPWSTTNEEGSFSICYDCISPIDNLPPVPINPAIKITYIHSIPTYLDDSVLARIYMGSGHFNKLSFHRKVEEKNGNFSNRFSHILIATGTGAEDMKRGGFRRSKLPYPNNPGWRCDVCFKSWPSGSERWQDDVTMDAISPPNVHVPPTTQDICFDCISFDEKLGPIPLNKAIIIRILQMESGGGGAGWHQSANQDLGRPPGGGAGWSSYFERRQTTLPFNGRPPGGGTGQGWRPRKFLYGVRPEYGGGQGLRARNKELHAIGKKNGGRRRKSRKKRKYSRKIPFSKKVRKTKRRRTKKKRTTKRRRTKKQK